MTGNPEVVEDGVFPTRHPEVGWVEERRNVVLIHRRCQQKIGLRIGNVFCCMSCGESYPLSLLLVPSASREVFALRKGKLVILIHDCLTILRDCGGGQHLCTEHFETTFSDFYPVQFEPSPCTG